MDKKRTKTYTNCFLCSSLNVFYETCFLCCLNSPPPPPHIDFDDVCKVYIILDGLTFPTPPFKNPPSATCSLIQHLTHSNCSCNFALCYTRMCIAFQCIWGGGVLVFGLKAGNRKTVFFFYLLLFVIIGNEIVVVYRLIINFQLIRKI